MSQFYDPVVVARTISKLRDDAGVHPDWEQVLEAQYRRFLRPGDTVFDIGAHRGRHLRVFAELVGASGRLEAFEPLPFAFRELGKLRLQAPVTLHNMALADFDGTSEFTFATGTPEESGLVQRIFNNPGKARPEKIQVRVQTLDTHTARLDRLDYVKIDTEGGEIGIIRGGRETLTRLRPVLSVEYGGTAYGVYGHTKATLFDLATSLGYVLCDILGSPITTAETWEAVCDHAAWDYWLVPSERLDEWTAKVLPPSSLSHRE